MKALRVLLINILLSIIVIGIAFSLDKCWPFLLPKALTITAWPLIAVGSILILLAAITLARHGGSTGAPGDPTRDIVTIGPYQCIRNPIYLGDGILILGLALLARSPSMFISCIFYMIMIDAFVRKVEEPATERRFGEEYI